MRKIPITPAVSILAGLCVVIYLVLTYVAPPALQAEVQSVFGLSRQGLAEGRWWQLVTYAFLHGSLLHLTFNMLGLWFAGRILERVVGTPKFLELYFAAAVFGGVAQMMLSSGGTTLIGASGSVCGVLLAFVTLFPNTEVVALLLFIPLRMRAKYLGLAVVGVSVVCLALGFESWIGHAAHLGGCLTGIVFALLNRRKAFARGGPVFSR